MRISRWRQVTLGVSCLTLVLAAVPGVAVGSTDPFAPYDQQPLTWGPCPFKPASGANPRSARWSPSRATGPHPAARHRPAGRDQPGRRDRHQRGRAPGQPGRSGRPGHAAGRRIAGLEPSVHQLYDFVGMDPRGTGHAGTDAADEQPVVCPVPTGRLPQDPLDARDRSAASIAAHQQTPRAIAEACQSNALTPVHHDVADRARHGPDPRAARRAKLNYLGYSYGTWLGAKYASLFPASAGKVVLDSSVNWQGRLQADFEDFPVIDQRQFDEVFVPWLTRQLPGRAGWDTGRGEGELGEGVRAYWAPRSVTGPVRRLVRRHRQPDPVAARDADLSRARAGANGTGRPPPRRR